MKNSVLPIINRLTAAPRRLFLLDGSGAILSAVLLPTLLVGFYDAFRMPRNIVYGLAAIAAVLALYSLSCYLLVGRNWRPYLLLIAVANTVYCLATIALVGYLHRQLTVLCEVYFLLEIMVVGILVGLELRAVRKASGQAE